MFIFGLPKVTETGNIRGITTYGRRAALKTGLFPFESSPVRAAVRFPLQIETTLCTEEREYPAITEDISSNGVLFIADDVPPVGSRVSFTMAMPAGVMGGTKDVLLDCIGHVVRHSRSDGRCKAGVIIDEYSLGSETDEA